MKRLLMEAVRINLVKARPHTIDWDAVFSGPGHQRRGSFPMEAGTQMVRGKQVIADNQIMWPYDARRWNTTSMTPQEFQERIVQRHNRK